MEWNEKLQNIIDYVENHLQRKEEPINIDDIAKMAGRYYQKKISTRLLTVLTTRGINGNVNQERNPGRL